MLLFIILNLFIITIIINGNPQLPNFIIILTDDQDLLLDGLVPMRKTQEIIANQGCTFTNAFVNSPICCPSRSTILTGYYAHNLMVWNNSIDGNCSSRHWQENFETNSISALLKLKKNYTTFYAGKYLNQYGTIKAGGIAHIPAGYDWWIGLKGNSRYYNYTLSINGSEYYFTDDYLTDKITEYSLEFLNQNMIKQQQFLMFLAPPASHSPFTPSPKYKKYYHNKKTVKNPSFNYSSNDKHWLVQMPPKYLPDDIQILDEIQRNRLRTLLTVDDMIETITKKLQQLQIIDNTYLIYLSDNGYHIGQFAQPWDKRQPYETDIRIPFMIRGPKIMKKTVCDYPISTVDLTPTIIDLVRIDDYRKFDGKSFKQHLFNNNNSNNNNNNNNRTIFVEYYGESNEKTVDPRCNFTQEDASQLSECTLDNWCKCQDSKNNTYKCVINFQQFEIIKFCQFINDFYEIYNLKNDPYELVNLYNTGKFNRMEFYRDLLIKFGNCKELNCSIDNY